MKNKILAAVSDSPSSWAVIEFLCNLSLCPDQVEITLLNVIRKPSSGEELMGRKFIEEQPERFHKTLEKAKQRLVEKGYFEESIRIDVINDPFPTIAEGIIEYFNKEHFNMVLIGRKKMSKAEEFVLGDASVKLVRALDSTAVVVVKIDPVWHDRCPL